MMNSFEFSLSLSLLSLRVSFRSHPIFLCYPPSLTFLLLVTPHPPPSSSTPFTDEKAEKWLPHSRINEKGKWLEPTISTNGTVVERDRRTRPCTSSSTQFNLQRKITLLLGPSLFPQLIYYCSLLLILRLDSSRPAAATSSRISTHTPLTTHISLFWSSWRGNFTLLSLSSFRIWMMMMMMTFLRER